MKPCPFCSGQPKLTMETRYRRADAEAPRVKTRWWSVHCQICFARGPYGLAQSAAIWRWNQRAGEIMPRTAESGATASQPRHIGVLGGV